MSNLMNKWGFLVPTILVIVMFVLGWVEGKHSADKWWQARTERISANYEKMITVLKDKVADKQLERFTVDVRVEKFNSVSVICEDKIISSTAGPIRCSVLAGFENFTSVPYREQTKP